ncbi:PREDICTED: myosin heavy [Prunus dulcis]|uniref:PREDICTED: myosin heavy n=1 Tax=Prunus dulcis TaxID=3755 RepID=A0A5E4FJD4_PRUDU|nr:PREDICTED: myosin heavy [Prunus dulcis]
MGQPTWYKFSSFERLSDSHLEKRAFLSFISDHCTLGCPNSLMATSKILVFSIFLALLFSRITADPPLPNDGASASAPEVAGSSLKLKLELLQLKVSLLESSLDEKNRELKEKDESIRQMEKIIQEKSNSIALIQSGIESVQGRDSLDVVELTDKSHVQAGGLEKQVKRLREDIIMQNKRKDELETRASIAEQKIRELSLKLENLQKVSDGQKIGIRRTERDLQVAEEEMMMEKFGISSISRDLTEAHGGWLLHTFAVHIGNFQSYIVTYWNELGRPALDLGIEKALEMKTQVEVWAELNIESIRTEHFRKCHVELSYQFQDVYNKWIPSLKKQSFAFIACLKPHIQSIATNTVDVYHSSKSSIAPLVFKVQKLADPYIQEAKKFTDPYIDQVAMVTRPHFDKVSVVLQPCAEKVIYAYGQFIRTATFYHHEVEEMLKGNEFTQSLASMEVAWFAAAALLALPAVFLFKLYSAIFRKKTKKRSYSSQENHTGRRLKRAYPAK